MTRPPRLALLSAFAAIYVIWGSTYLAIRFAVLELPPFLMAAIRWIPAGVALYAWRRAAGDPAPTLRQWRAAAVVGLLLIVGGNGLVSWAEQSITSGLAALLVAIVPLWIALLAWRQGGPRPTLRVWSGIGLGVAGVALLVGPAAFGDVSLLGVLLVLAATVLWATGSIHSRKAGLPASPLLSAAMQMIAGGVALVVVGLLRRETLPPPASVSLLAWGSVAFLALFGSIVAYSAYVWLLQATRPELVATYAFVNPVVAVLLGIAFAGERFTAWTLAAAALIVAAVAIVVTSPRAPPPKPAGVEPDVG